MKLVLGTLSVMVLKGLKTSNEKLVSSGFQFEYEELEGAVREVMG